MRGYDELTACLLTMDQPDRLVHVSEHDWRPATRVTVVAGHKAERSDKRDPPYVA